MKTQKFLLSLVLMLSAFGISTVKAQSIDTVCAGATGVPYSVTNTTGSTYYWTVTGGTQASGGTTNSITVDWNSTTGTDTLKVVEMNQWGCFGDTVKLPVFRMPLPTAAINKVDTVCFNNANFFDVTLTGIGPWNFSYSDGTDTFHVNNVLASPYRVNTPALNPTSVTTVTYSITAVSNFFGCNGTTSGTAAITTIPKPVTSAIFH